MKKLLAIVITLVCLDAYGQIPTYRWISGSQEFRQPSTLESTTPGPRRGSSSFTDSEGNFWIFSGYGSDQGTVTGPYNDTWKYDRTAERWIWMSGQMTVDRLIPDGNNSLLFDGVDDEITLPVDPLDYDADFTVEFFFKTTTDGPFITWGSPDQSSVNVGWSIEMVNFGNEIELFKDGSTYLSAFLAAPVNDDNWHHIAMVFDVADNVFQNATITLYVDGLQVEQVFNNILDNQNPNGDYLTSLGSRRGFGSSLFYQGQMDEVRFWGVARTGDEILSNYTIQLSGNEDDLSAFYDFNQGVANSGGNYETELLDRTTNGVNGSLGNIYRDAVFFGQMAEVRVWDNILTSEEILNLATAPVVGNEAGLVAAYDFSDGVPEGDNTGVTSLSDMTVNSHDGIINTFALQGTSSNFVETFLPSLPSSYSNQSGATIAMVEDFDEDTWLDVVTTTGNNSFSLLINDQTGGFSGFTEFDVVDNALDLTIGDWNEDDNLDVAVAAYTSPTDSRIRVYFGDGAGDFPTFVDIDPGTFVPEAIRSADMNGDMHEDLVVLMPEIQFPTFSGDGSDEVRIYYGDGTGAFGTPDAFDVGYLYSESMAIEDFNGDGFNDIVVGLFNNINPLTTVGVLINDGLGSFNAPVLERYGTLLIDEIAPADIDLDGDMDLIVSQGNDMGVLFGNGDGTFQNMVSTDLGFTVREIAIIGYNIDNLLEITLSSTFESSYHTFLIGNDGTFTKKKRFSSQTQARQLAIADLDKNGFNDFVIPQSGNQLQVLNALNNDLTRTASVQAMDFDGDNDHVSISTLRPFNADFTWEGWIKTEDNAPLFTFAPDITNWDPSGSGGFSLAIKGGELTFLAEGQAPIAHELDILRDGEWHHVAVTVNVTSDLINLYIDGGFVMQDFRDLNAATGDLNYVSKLGYATGNFRDDVLLVDNPTPTGQTPESNWTEGNDFPVAETGRMNSAYWTDANGKFNIFGGEGLAGFYNSIRQFDPLTKQWTVIKGTDVADEAGVYGIQGIADAANIPPARTETNATVDLNGNVWIFGGSQDGVDVQYNDLWMYNPLSNEWMWVSGGSVTGQNPVHGTMGSANGANVPGARENNAIWSDSDGNIWIFGGLGIDSDGNQGFLNDLWRYDVMSGEWTWINGSSLGDEGGVYGVDGTYDPANIPGGRGAMLQWLDSNGIVWFFGGFGYDKFGVSSSYLNDLWSYDPVANQWAWHSGSDFANSTGSYNEPGLSSTDYVPGARRNGTGWVDTEDNLWLFGGFQQNALGTGLYNDFWKYEPATNEWTWFTGLNSTAASDDIGVYGSIDTGSVPHPGSRHGALFWTDNDGNFWLLSGAEVGSSSFGFYNDLWKYEPDKEKWTYLGGDTNLSINEGVYGSKGIGSSTNEPKSRWHGASWVGDDGKLWFFGGINHNESTGNIAWINDLWFYDPESSVYTWMGGSSDIDASGVYGTKGEPSQGHIPGARSSTAYWKDSDGNFWMFGGYESFEYNNDLWRFNPNTLEWTWVSGNNFQNTPGTYGQQGVADPANIIGARRYTDAWVDPDGKVWIFGGNGYDSQAQLSFLNDLWMYDPETNMWTWMHGSEFGSTPGNFGTMGVASPDNLPPPRYGQTTWIDDSGNLWMFGGWGQLGAAGSLSTNELNDLWKFDRGTNMWTWMGGSDEFITDGTYGVQGQFDEANLIPGKQRAQAFKSQTKSFWLFGGRNGASINDFWEIKFTPGLPLIETPETILQTGFTFTYDEPWANEYQVQVALTNDFSDTFYDQQLPQSSSQLSSLEPGTNYYYRVNAINEIGTSGFSATEQVLTLPATPTFASPELAITELTQTHARLNWEPTSGIFDGYFLDVSQDPTFTDAGQALGGYVAKTLGIVQLEDLDNLTPGTRYYVRLQSYNSSGVSEFSETISFLTQPATVIYLDEVVSEITQNSALISWNATPEIIDNYQITVSTLDDGFVDTNAFLTDYNATDIEKDQTSIRIEGLESGTFYYALVYSENSSGLSQQSNLITILTTPESPVFDLETAISEVTQMDATITWQAPDDVLFGYQLEVSTDFTFANTNLMLEGYGRDGVPKNFDLTQLTETVPGLTPGQTYFARVRAFNASGLSPNSNIISFTAIPRAPTLNNPSNISQTSASISWSGISGADLYLLDVNRSDDFAPETQLFSEFPLAVPFEVLSDLEPGIRYYIRVQSGNQSGNSGDVTPADYGNATFITIPGTPVLNDPDNFSQESFRVSWPAVEGADSYVVDASDNFFQTFLNGFSQLEVTSPEVQITGLSPGNEYQVRVRAKNESGSSPNIGVFDVEPLPETPISRDASNISASVFTTNWDPSDGADFYVLEVSQDNFQTFHYNETLNSSNPVQMTGLTAGAQYQYRVKAGNASGESPYSNTIAVVAQNNAQSLAISSIDFNEEFQEGTNSATVTINLAGGLGNPTVAWRYRGILDTEWSTLMEISENASSIQFEITSFMLDDIGVEFDVFANDGITFVEETGNKIKRSFNESQSEKLPSLVFSNWQMISIPFILEQPEVVNVFNELGGLEYKKAWRIMHYENGAYLDGITGFNNIEVGQGYWFNALSEVTINVGAGQTNATIPFNMTLNQGWNQIGNPFNATINWNEILANGNLLATVDGLIVYDVEEREFSSGSTLGAFEGAFVWSDQETTVEVFPTGTSGRASEPSETIASVDGENWRLPIHLNLGGKTRKVAGVGMDLEASELKDQHDELVPPRFENYLEMFTTKPYLYPYFSTDIVPIKDTYVWSYELTSNIVSGPATLEWDHIPLLNHSMHVWLVDESAGRVIKMTEESEYRFSFSGQHQFTVHYSKDPNYRVTPANLALGDVFPNPASSTAAIPVLLPARESSYGLELALYDMQGKRVKTITNGDFLPGLYQFVFEIDDAIKNGIYIYQLTFADPSVKSRQKKLLIKK